MNNNIVFPTSRTDSFALITSRKGQTCSADTVMLPDGFVPGEYDVICQRGKDSFEHIGNKRFRELIDEHIDTYLRAKSRHEKTSIVTKIYDKIRCRATKPSEGFVKKDLLTRRWFQVSEKESRDKVGQALRDSIKTIRAGSRRKNAKSSPRPDKRSIMTQSENGREVRRLMQQIPPSSNESQLEMAYEQRNAMASRFFENQMHAIGPFPTMTTTQGSPDEIEGGSTTRNFLDSSIEPIDYLQDHAGSRKRRHLPMENGTQAILSGTNGVLDERHDLAGHFIQEKLLSKRPRQASRTEDFLALRRLSLIGDQTKLMQNSLELQQRLENSGEKLFPSNVPSQQGYGAASSNTNSAIEHLLEGPFDQKALSCGTMDLLEPTPIAVPHQQRADYLAFLHERLEGTLAGTYS